MTKEEARKASIKFLIHLYADPENPELLAPIINAEDNEDWGAIYIMLDKVKEFIDKLQKGMKGG